MNSLEFEALRNASQDIIAGEKDFDDIGKAIDKATAARHLDPWLQSRMRKFPVMTAGSHDIATRAIELCMHDGADDAVGDTTSERYLSLTARIDEQAADVIPELRAANPTFEAALGYCALNQDIQTKVCREQPDMIRRRGKIPEELPPVGEIMGHSMTLNARLNTRASLLHDMLRACVQAESLPEPDVLTARAWDRFDLYVNLSAQPGQVFSRTVLGQEVAQAKQKAIVGTNSIDMLSITSWSPAIDEYLRSGKVPEYAYRLAGSLLVTDADLDPIFFKKGVCPVHAPLKPYTTPGVSRPTDRQIRRFFNANTSGQVDADGRFMTVAYQVSRGIEAASQTIFADKDYRKAAETMVKLILKADRQTNKKA